MTYQILVGNNLDVLPTLPDNSVDSIVTDPPYELGFMGKKWDSSGIAYSVDLWQQCLRVLKPGGHLLSFGGTRTWHRVAVAIEDAGFEVRDSIAWMYGSGFPKSLDVSKAIDKQSGYDGEVLGTEVVDVGMQGGSMHAGRSTKLQEREIKELSPEAQQWQGWGTALKPAFEPIVVARKPLAKGNTVAANVLTHGTGGLNIDGSRIGRAEGDNSSAGNRTATFGTQDTQSGGDGSGGWEQNLGGRWPANVILDPYTAELLDEQSDASRFFYVAKASKRDRNEGLDELEAKVKPYGNRDEVPQEGDKPGSVNDKFTTQPAKNFHPTVKPTDLMRYLVKLVTPPNGTVLDPFTGSGSTGKAAILEGFDFIGIEMTEEYLPIIEGRLKHAEAKVAERKEQEVQQETEKLF